MNTTRTVYVSLLPPIFLYEITSSSVFCSFAHSIIKQNVSAGRNAPHRFSLKTHKMEVFYCSTVTSFFLQTHTMSLDDSLFNGSITVSETVDDGTDANTTFYSPIFGTTLAMPEWEAVLTVVSLSIVIVVTVIGNILVIISVFTHPPLKITPNFFIVSLAAADLTVSIFVLPFNVIYTVSWTLID